jgi:predicted acetyltransferase
MLTDPRAVELKPSDGLFVRLVDVPRALADRTYANPVDVVLDVTDERCPWNARRYRLAGDATGATCEPTTAAADLALSATELGAAYLGGTSLDTLAAAGRVQELTPGALATTATAFRGSRAPWCPEMF